MINPSQKDVEMFCLALVKYKILQISKKNDPGVNFRNLEIKLKTQVKDIFRLLKVL